MNQELDQEDLAALGVLDEVAHGAGQEDTAPVDPPPADGEAEVLRRLYVESLGLLAYSLLPAQPQPSTRALLLAHLMGDETQEVSPLVIGAAHGAFAAAQPLPSPAAIPGAPASLPHAVAPDLPAAPHRTPETKHRGEPAVPAVRTESPEPAVAPLRELHAGKIPRRSRWPAALATFFALVAVGLGVWVAMLLSEVAYRDSQIRGLGNRIAEADRLSGELEATKTELAALEQRHGFVTAPGTTVYALRPPETGSPQPLARGHLYLAPDRRHWQLEVRGLRPEPEPQDYQLWFVVDGLPLSGGVFDARAGKAALLSDDSMPARTTAIAITLERKGGTASPTSPILLTAASAVQL